jgi:hypothetical protein
MSGERRGSWLADWSIGLAGLCLPLIGIAGIFLAILGIFGNENVMGAGVCLLASAVALGALLRSLTAG